MCIRDPILQKVFSVFIKGSNHCVQKNRKNISKWSNFWRYLRSKKRNACAATTKRFYHTKKTKLSY